MYPKDAAYFDIGCICHGLILLIFKGCKGSESRPILKEMPDSVRISNILGPVSVPFLVTVHGILPGYHWIDSVYQLF